MKKLQYTIRGIPARLDERLRVLARREGKSLNEEVLEVLRRGLGDGEEAVRHGDMDDLAGSWVRDPESEKVLDEMDRIDEGMWE